MSRSSSGPEWSGDMLDRPEMVAAFAAQLRRVLSDQAAFVAHIRRDAEAMWRANPPDEYGTFEAWWRHSKVTAPFNEIQDLLEKASTLTFKLEARYRRHRHTVPEKRQAAAEAKLQAAIPQGDVTPERPAVQPRQPRTATAREDDDFMGLIRRDGRRPA